MDDIEAIKQLKARMTRASDTKDWDVARSALADDFRMTSPSGEVVDGADSFITFVRNAITGVFTVHHPHVPEIELTSPTTATGTWMLEDLNRWPDGGELHGYGINEDTYVKVDGEWRIASSKVTLLGPDGGPTQFGRPTFSLGALAARQAITDRIHDYCRAMDQMDHELGYSVWHDDGLAHYDDVFEGTGREFVDWVLDSHAKMQGTFHQVTNIRVDVAGDTATSEAYHIACNRIGSTDFVMRGWYRDTWSRRQGEWRIDERRQTGQMTQFIPVVEMPTF